MDDEWTTAFLRMRRALRKLGRSHQDAEDIVQEAYLRLMEYGATHVVREPRAFLMRAALNLSKDVARTLTRHGNEVLPEDVPLVDTAPTPEDARASRERIEHLVGCINQLPEKTRAVFLSHRIDGMSYQQIALDRGLSVSSVEKHVAKAVLLLSAGMVGWYP